MAAEQMTIRQFFNLLSEVAPLTQDDMFGTYSHVELKYIYIQIMHNHGFKAPQIAAFFGYANDQSVYSALRKVAALQADPRFKARLAKIANEILTICEIRF